MAGRLRITGGTLARRLFDVPPGADRHIVRPTGDRVREALFSALGSDVDDARVLDAFGGSGALGFEALSRGAKSCTALEKSPKVAAVIKQNARTLKLGPAHKTLTGDALKLLPRMKGGFDVVLADPPYRFELDDAWMTALCGAVAPGGILILERDKRTSDTYPAGWKNVWQRTYGSTVITMLTPPRADEALDTEALDPHQDSASAPD